MEIPEIRRGGYRTLTWHGVDAWYARSVGDGTYLMVSRRRLDVRQTDRCRQGAWTYGWRWSRWWLFPADMVAEGPTYWEVGHPRPTGSPSTFDSEIEAMIAADKHAAGVWKG